MKCVNHPDRDGAYCCQKMHVCFCTECAVCPSPVRYCRFRKGCMIWHQEEEASEGARSGERTPG